MCIQDKDMEQRLSYEMGMLDGMMMMVAIVDSAGIDEGGKAELLSRMGDVAHEVALRHGHLLLHDRLSSEDGIDGGQVCIDLLTKRS